MKSALVTLLFTMPTLGALAGCGDGSVSVSGSSTEASVKGRVTINGKPATRGEVIFDPVNVSRPAAKARRASINADGSYTIITLIGDNMALVEGPEVAKAGLTMSNRQRVDVASGENSIDLQVPSVVQSGPAPAKKKGRHSG